MNRRAILTAGIAGALALAWLWTAQNSPAPDLVPATVPLAPVVSAAASATPVAPLPASELASASLEAVARLATLDQVLASKNDNDPRLDGELRTLSEDSKRLFRARYGALAREARNERGTVVFLLGRNLAKVADVEFLSEVLAEEPCLGLASCSEPPAPSKHDHEHIASADEVTLAYPQLVALKAAESALFGKGTPPEVAIALRQAVDKARTSPVQRVAAMAEALWARLPR